MDETMPDASPLSQQFLASLASFMESEHELKGEGDISSKVKVAISESKASSDGAPATSEHSAQTNRNVNGTS